MSPAEIARLLPEIRMLVAMRKTRREIATELDLTYAQVKGLCERRGIPVHYSDQFNGNGNGDRGIGQHAFPRERPSVAIAEWPDGVRFEDDPTVPPRVPLWAGLPPATHVPTIAGPPTGSAE